MTLHEIEKRLSALEKAFLQAQKNQVSVTAKADDTSNKVVELTPYKTTVTAYYNETEKVFYDAPEGIVSVYFDDYSGAYSVNRIDNRLIVSFDALEHETNITIIIQ